MSDLQYGPSCGRIFGQGIYPSTKAGYEMQVSNERHQAAELMATVRATLKAGIDRTQAALIGKTDLVQKVATISPQRGWLRFMDDASREYGSLSVKVSTKVISSDDFLDDFTCDIGAESTKGENFVVKVLPTVTQRRFFCSTCTEETVEKLARQGKQYTALVTGISANCQKCGNVAQAGTGCLVTITYHLVNKVRVQRGPNGLGEDLVDSDGKICNALGIRGYLGTQDTVTQPAVIQAIQHYRAE